MKEKDIAVRIFERGLEKFPSEVEFVLRYLGFLISINDETSEFISKFFSIIDANTF